MTKRKGWKGESYRHSMASKGIQSFDINKINKIRNMLSDERVKSNKNYHSLNKIYIEIETIYVNNKNTLTEEEKMELNNILKNISAVMLNRASNEKEINEIINELHEFQRKQVIGNIK